MIALDWAGSSADLQLSEQLFTIEAQVARQLKPRHEPRKLPLIEILAVYDMHNHKLKYIAVNNSAT
jgi:hypothetical protein